MYQVCTQVCLSLPTPARHPRPTSERGVEVRGVVGRTAQLLLCPRLPTTGKPGPPHRPSSERAGRGQRQGGSGWEWVVALGWGGCEVMLPDLFGGWLGEGVGWGDVAVRGGRHPLL